jgi:type IV secretion system protein VirB3
MAGGKLKADPLFLGLTRPPMMLGVSYMYFILNFSITMCFYINTTSFLVLLIVFPITHGIGYMICLREPRAIELIAVKGNKTMKVKPLNRRFHGYTNSYDAF